jgi:hypothetical protein
LWVPKVGTLLERTQASLTAVDAAGLSADASRDRAAAADALAAFGRTTDRVRDLLADGQPLTASSVAFGEAAQQLATASAALASVVPTERLAVGIELGRARRQEVYALLGAVAVTLLSLLLLLPRARIREQGPIEAVSAPSGLGLALRTPASDTGRLGPSEFDVDIARVLAGGTTADPVPEQPHQSEEAIVGDLERESQLRLNVDAQVDLAETARLCGDLARVKDSNELPAILGRVAAVLDAAGIVVWIAERDRSALRPASSHGYSDHTLSKMKVLPVAAENAVSVAFRTGRTEVVRGTRERNGAIVAPIVAAAGCAGAMAVEVRNGAEASPAVQAVAAIIAAQLASLVS